MIFIKNTQRTIKINATAIKKDVQIILNTLGYSDFDLSIWFTTNATIRRYNRDFRKKDKPTDILSFPFYPELKAGETIQPASEEERILGDLIISLAYVQKDASRYDMSFQERLQHLLVHGICHLLGYDHETDADYEVMHAQEKKLLKKLAQ